MVERDGKRGLGADFFVGAGERDAISIVRDASRQTLPKRFYKDVRVDESDGVWRVLLDGRPVRTPRQTLVALPTRAAAELAAAEWAAQKDEINPVTMPVTRLLNATFDGVAADVGITVAEIVKYASSDLLCYRAAEPPALVAAQTAEWNPILAFADQRFGARMRIAEGIVFVEQEPASVTAIAHAVDTIAKGQSAALHIAALHVVTTLTGSALLALAVHEGALSRDDAWRAAHVDEDEQMRLWGMDAEALRRRAARFAEMRAACALLERL